MVLKDSLLGHEISKSRRISSTEMCQPLKDVLNVPQVFLLYHAAQNRIALGLNPSLACGAQIKIHDTCFFETAEVKSSLDPKTNGKSEKKR